MERKYYFRGLGVGIIVTAVIMGILTSKNKNMTDQEIITRAKELGMVENTVLADMPEESIQSSDIADGNISEAKNEETEVENTPQQEESKVGDVTISEQNSSKTEGTDMVGQSASESGTSDASKENDSKAETADTAGRGDSNAAEEGNAEQDDDKVEEQNNSENGDKENASQTGSTTETPSEEDTNARMVTINSGDGSHTVAAKLADVGAVASADAFDEYLCQYGYDKRLRTGTFSIPAHASEEQIARIVTGIE